MRRIVCRPLPAVNQIGRAPQELKANKSFEPGLGGLLGCEGKTLIPISRVETRVRRKLSAVRDQLERNLPHGCHTLAAAQRTLLEAAQ